MPFAITTNGGQPFSVSTPFATVHGTGWVNVREIRIAGSTGSLPVTWTSTTAFQVSVPLAPGGNTITLQAIGFNGATLSTSTITITNTGVSQAASAANLAISEVMYHPAAPNAAEQAAGYDFPDAEDEFEFVELLNISSSPVSLTGAQFTNGFDYTLPARVLDPGERLVIARNPAAFTVRYPAVPAAMRVGPFTAGKLQDSGERITLLDAGGAVIRSFVFDDDAPWPLSADGGGMSLVVIRPETSPDLALPQNWRHSALPDGNPGAGDVTSYDTWKSANAILSDSDDVDSDGLDSFLEYSHGTAPLEPNGARVYSAMDASGQPLLQLTRRIGADDVMFDPQHSMDLAAWAADPVLFQYAGVAYNLEGTETVSYRITPPAAEAVMRRFVRLRASR